MNFLRCTRRNRYRCVNGTRFVSVGYVSNLIALDARGRPPLTEVQRIEIERCAEVKRAAARKRAEKAVAEKKRVEQEAAADQFRAEQQLIAARNVVIFEEARRMMTEELAVRDDISNAVQIVVPSPVQVLDIQITGPKNTMKGA